MSRVTPGRRIRDDAPHLPFNHEPKKRGTRTGQVMPDNVRRDSDGFESPEAFFHSPATEAPGTSRSIMTTMSRSVLKNRAANATHATGRGGVEGDYSTPAPNRRGGKMAALAAGSDDDVPDDDDLGIGESPTLPNHLSSPATAPYFPSGNTPRVSLPKRSILPTPPSPVNFDRLPTPKSQRRSTGRDQTSPDGTTISRYARGVGLGSPLMDTNDQGMDNYDAGGFSADNIGMDDDGMDDQEASVQVTPRRNGKTPKKSKVAVRESESPDQSMEVEDTRERGINLSSKKASRRKDITSLVDPERSESPSDDEDVGGPSFSHDMGGGDDGLDVGGDEQYDQQADDTMANGDETGHYGGQDDDDVEEDVEEDAALEEEAMRREEAGSGEEESDKDATPRPRKKASKPKPAAKPAKKVSKVEELAREAKRKRLSTIEKPDDSEKWTGDFRTRSGRAHFKPIKYWLGERFEYTPGPGLAVKTEVVRVPVEEAKPLAKRPRGRSTSNKPGSSKRKASESVEPEGDGWDADTQPTGRVLEFPSGSEIERRIAWPAARLAPRSVNDGEFLYQKVYGEDQFIASGVVFIPIGSLKKSKPSKDNSYVFYVIEGAVRVTIHKTRFLMSRGGSFMVPRGNNYMIENVTPNTEVRLFFAQGRKMLANEAEEEHILSQRARSESVAAARRQSVVSSRAEEDEGERAEEAGSGSEEETQKVKQKEPKPLKKKKRSS